MMRRLASTSQQVFRRLRGARPRPSQSRFSHGGGDLGEYANKPGFLGWYLRANEAYPIVTAIVTSAGLWFTGDFVAQQISAASSEATTHHGDQASDKKKESVKAAEQTTSRLDMNRLVGTTAEGSLVGGGVGYFWYATLDKIVASTGFQRGSLRFVAAKLGLEMAIWHPISLCSFWVIVGLWEGHSIARIKQELHKEFAPTLASEIALWGPLDIFNFWKVPVHLQVIFANAGCLIEAVGLSYIHDHGFPGFVTGKEEGGVIKDKGSSMSQRLPKLTAFDDLYTSLSLPRTVAHARVEFKAMDVHGRGYITAQDLQARLADPARHGKMAMLPGISDAAVNVVASKLLFRKADLDGNGKVSLQEYLRMIKAFHSTKYRHDFTSDVVFSLFDENGDGRIDKSELARLAVVLVGQSKASVFMDLMMTADTNKDGFLSKEEMRAAFKTLQSAANV